MSIEPLFSMANPDSIHHCHTPCVVAHGTLAGTVCLPGFRHLVEFRLTACSGPCRHRHYSDYT